MPEIQTSRREFIGASAALLGGLAFAEGGEWKAAYPEQIAEVEWLRSHQRACFGIDEKTVGQAMKDGVNVVIGGTNAGGPNGFAGGHWVLNKSGDGFVAVLTGTPMEQQNLERMKRNVKEVHERGGKVLSEVIRMNMVPWVQAEHPEWQDLNQPGGKPLKPEELAKSNVLGCWNSPYGDFFIRSQIALLKMFDFDGYNLDGFGCWSQCYCPACKRSYKEDAGGEIPVGADVNNSAWRHYVKWRLWRYTAFVQRWTAALKAVKPDFVAAPWTTGPGRWWHWMGAPAVEGSDAMHRVLDAPFLELLWDFPPDQGSNLLPSFTVRYYRGLTGDRPAWILPYLCEQGQFGMQAPAAECDLRNMTVITNGCLAAQGMWQQSSEATLKGFNRQIEERETYTAGAKSLKWAALFVGESSRLLYGLSGVSNEVPIGNWMGSGVDSVKMGAALPSERRMPAHMESAVGVFRAMMEDHLPLDVIIEPDLERYETLKQYKVLILPNAACLSDRMNENITRFVKEGGGLVALHEASVANEFGDVRKDFGLAGVMGVHFKGTSDHSARWPNYPNWVQVALNILKPEHPIVDHPQMRSNIRGGDRVEYIGWMTNVELATGTQQVGRRLTAPTEWPFIAVNEANPGRSVYFACDLGQAYFIAPYHYQGRLLTNAIRWAAKESLPPFEVEVPMAVQAAFYTQNGGKRHIVHLLNELNSSANRALPINNPSMRMEVIPIHDVKITTKGFRPSKAFVVPGNQTLKVTPAGNGAEVTVPRLGTHAMVVFE
jgi:Trehalose utilisation